MAWRLWTALVLAFLGALQPGGTAAQCLGLVTVFDQGWASSVHASGSRVYADMAQPFSRLAIIDASDPTRLTELHVEWVG